MTLASRIAVMHQGRLQQYAEPREVYARPANMFVAGFMGSPSMNFLPAEIVAGDGGPAIALTDAKGSAVLPLPRETATRVSPGTKVVLGIRPEHIMGGETDRPVRTAVGRLNAAVEVVEPTGAETIVVARVGVRELVARFEPDAAPKEGESLSLGVDMSKACLFDPDTERLI
jgi:multiple sugar transport system ATP-binding protein